MCHKLLIKKNFTIIFFWSSLDEWECARSPYVERKNGRYFHSAVFNCFQFFSMNDYMIYPHNLFVNICYCALMRRHLLKRHSSFNLPALLKHFSYFSFFAINNWKSIKFANGIMHRELHYSPTTSRQESCMIRQFVRVEINYHFLHLSLRLHN